MTIINSTVSRLGRVFSRNTATEDLIDDRLASRFDALNMAATDKLPKRRLFRN